MAVTKKQKANKEKTISYWSKPVTENDSPKKITLAYTELSESGDNLTVKTAEGRMFQIAKDRVVGGLPKSEPKVAATPEEKPKRVTKSVKESTPKKQKRKKLTPRMNTTRGMGTAQLAFDSGNALQRDIFRRLKRDTPDWSRIPVDKKVILNIKALRAAKVPRDLIPGIVDQMVRQYIVTERTLRTQQGSSAAEAIISAFDSEISGGVKPLITRSLGVRKAFGGSNVYDESGKLVARKGKNRRERITTGRGKTGKTKTPQAARKKNEPPVSSASGVREFTEQRRKVFDPRAEKQAKFLQGLERAVQEEQKTVVIGEETDKKTGKTRVITAKVGGAKTQTKGLGRLSDIGKSQNFTRDVEIAQRYIADALKAGNITKSGYLGILKEQPHFQGMDIRELTKIAAAVKVTRRKGKVERRIKRSAGKPKENKQGVVTKFNVAGEDITGTKRRVSTKKQIDTARAKSRSKETRSKERRAAALRGEVAPQIERPKAASKKEARRLEAEVEGGVKKAEPVFKKPTVKGIIDEAAASGKVRVTKARAPKTSGSGKLSKIEQIHFNALKAAGSKTNARLLARSIKPSKNVIKLAKAGGIMGLATSFGANYILSQLEENKKGRR